MEYIKKHLVTILTTLLSIAVTIIVGWYTIKWGTVKAQEAEIEREIKVKEELVSLIEENIINKTPIELPRLSRIIQTKSEIEKIQKEITSVELIKVAEYNLLKSKYLDFNQKQIYRAIFDSIYSSISLGPDAVNNNSFMVLKDSIPIDSLLINIKNCNVERANTNLNKIITLYSSDISRLKNLVEISRNKSPTSMNKYFVYLTAIMSLVAYFYYGIRIRLKLKIANVGSTELLIILLFLATLLALSSYPLISELMKN